MKRHVVRAEARAYMDKLVAHAGKRLTQEDITLFSEYVQNWVDETAYPVVVLSAYPDGGVCINSTRGMPTYVALGLLKFFTADNEAGMTCHRVINGLRLNREYGKTFKDE